MSYLFLFSPSGAQSSKPRIFIVTFYDRSFSSAAASPLLRPFPPFSSSFCIIVLPCANYPLFLVPRYFSSFLLPLYFLIFPIAMLLALLWNCTIKSGHFVSSQKARTQILRESEPFASRQEKEKFDGDVFYPSLTCEIQACNRKGRHNVTLHSTILKIPSFVTGETTERNKILRYHQAQCVIGNASGTIRWWRY